MTPSDLGPALVAGAELMCTAVDTPVHSSAADVVVHVDVDTQVIGDGLGMYGDLRVVEIGEAAGHRPLSR